MQQAVVAVTTRVGVKGAFDVDLPLDAATLNERLFDIGLWLIDRHIPHQARILWDDGIGIDAGYCDFERRPAATCDVRLRAAYARHIACLF